MEVFYAGLYVVCATASFIVLLLIDRFVMGPPYYKPVFLDWAVVVLIWWCPPLFLAWLSMRRWYFEDREERRSPPP